MSRSHLLLRRSALLCTYCSACIYQVCSPHNPPLHWFSALLLFLLRSALPTRPHLVYVLYAALLGFCFFLTFLALWVWPPHLWLLLSLTSKKLDINVWPPFVLVLFSPPNALIWSVIEMQQCLTLILLKTLSFVFHFWDFEYSLMYMPQRSSDKKCNTTRMHIFSLLILFCLRVF